MIWIIDASAAIEVVLGQKHSETVGMILQEAEEVIAPELFVAEVANVFWKYHRFEGLALDAYIQYTQTTLKLADDFTGHVNILDHAIKIAVQHEVTIHDALYLGLSAMINEAGIISIEKN